MQPDGPLDEEVDVQLFSVTFTALAHDDPGDHDEPLDLLGLVSITGTGVKELNFDDLPAGQNLFGMVGDSTSGIVVTGQLPVLNSNNDGTWVHGSDTINTSKALGQELVIGIDDQSFDPTGPSNPVNDGAFFTYVTSPDTKYLAGAPGGLNQTEADDADNVLFGGTSEVKGAFLRIAQVVGNGTAALTLTAFDLPDSLEDGGRDFVLGQGGATTKVSITEVYVHLSTLESDPLESFVSGAEAGDSGDITINIIDGVAYVSGLSSDMYVVWRTSADHDQVLVQAQAGTERFDIGNFGLLEGQVNGAPLDNTTFVEDDGPTIGLIQEGLVDFATGSSVSYSINGDIGTDVDEDNLTPYTLVDWTESLTFNGNELIAVPTTTSGITQVGYWMDTNDNGTAGDAGDTEFFRLSLNQTANDGAGSYTFQVLQDPPAAFLEFKFTDLPSGQNLFAFIAEDKALPDGRALLVFSNESDVSNSNGVFTNVSGTINTSKGGGPITIGDANQMYDSAGEGAVFVYAMNPRDQSIAGLGLTQKSADDSDNIQFASTFGADTGECELVQIQGNNPAALEIAAYDIDVGNGISGTEGRAFVEDPETGSTRVNVMGVDVYIGGELVESWIDSDLDGTYEHVLDHADVTVDWTEVETGIYTAQVGGLTIEGGVTTKIQFKTEGDHDMAKINYLGGAYDIGGFNILSGLDTPDLSLEFTAEAIDGDGDVAYACWEVGVDGTGAYDGNGVTGIENGELSDCVLDEAFSPLAPTITELANPLAANQIDYLL